jgi:ABC-type Fe3+-hydroxamate transport system substrate-binding protein
MRTAVIAAALALLVAGCGEEAGEPAQQEAGAGFPVSIEHKFGTTTVDHAPERVVTVGFNDQDFALALGVTPVGVRQFQGGIDITERPWAQDELGGAEPQIIGAEDLEFEKIAALRPDLILAVYSGLTKKDYGTLSKIAPTVAQSDEYPDYGVPWQEQAEVSSRALGREEQGTKVVDSVEGEIAAARKEHPEFDGSTFALASAGAGTVYVFGPQDLRSRFFESLGFQTPPEIEKLAGDSFFGQLSEEQLRMLDQDVLVVYGSEKDFEGFPLFQRLDAVREGRVIYMDVDGDFANALGFSSPLSIPFALDEAVPQLSTAVEAK